MEFKKIHVIGIVSAAMILLINAIFFLNSEDKNLFFFIGGIALGIGFIPFIIDIYSKWLYY